MDKIILQQLLDIVKDSLKSIDPYKVDALKRHIEYFDDKYPFLSSSLLDVLSQGDILDGVPMTCVDVDVDGSLICRELRTKVMVLSNTCDCQRKDFLVAPIIEWESECEDIFDANNNYPLMYINEQDISNMVIDFSKTFSVSQKLYNNQVSCSKIKRLHSLTSLGFYFLYLKLSIYLMRPEDYELNESREK